MSDFRGMACSHENPRFHGQIQVFEGKIMGFHWFGRLESSARRAAVCLATSELPSGDELTALQGIKHGSRNPRCVDVLFDEFTVDRC